MTASLVGSTMFSSPHWLEGNEISPGVQVVSGPVDLNSISFVPSLDDPLFHNHEGHNYPKCRPSRMLLEYEPPLVQAGVLISPTQPLGTGNGFNTGDAPEFSQKFYTTVVVKSTRDHIVLPHNANLGSIQPMSADHNEDFPEAADHTAHTLADTWLEYAKHTNATQLSKSVARSQAQPSSTSSSPRSWSLHAQITEMAQAGLDSSLLSPFLPQPDLDPPHIFPPVENVGLDPHSEEYFQKLVTALDLETENYAPSPETISFDLPVHPLPPDHYAKHMLSRMQTAHQSFSQIKSDLHRHQKDIYDRKVRFLEIPSGKVVCIRKEPQTTRSGQATRFLRTFDGPFQVIGHPYDRTDLLTLKKLSTGHVLPHPVNIEKCLVIPDQETYDLQPPNDVLVEPEVEVPAPIRPAPNVNPELSQVAYEFGKYLSSLPNKTATASQACKQVYLTYPSAREILSCHGKLRGLVKACPYLQMDGESHGGLYLLSLNQEAFRKLFP